MMNLKNLALLKIMIFISACSMDAEKTVFIGADSDYLGHSLKIEGMIDNGKPVNGHLKVHPSSDGSYYVAAQSEWERFLRNILDVRNWCVECIRGDVNKLKIKTKTKISNLKVDLRFI